MKINLIVAMDVNGVIGVSGKLPWHLPEDLRRFKELTLGKAIIMGRKTWESLPIQPLPGRSNIIITSDITSQGYLYSVFRYKTLTHALTDIQFAHDEVFIIGGARLYAEAFPLVDRIYLTVVNHEVVTEAGDQVVRFPEKLWTLSDGQPDTVIEGWEIVFSIAQEGCVYSILDRK